MDPLRQNNTSQFDNKGLFLLRVLVVVICAMYFQQCAHFYSAATETPLAIALAVVWGGVIMLSLIMCVLAERFSQTQSGSRQFSLSSIMLILLGLAIFLTPVASVIRAHRAGIGSLQAEIGNKAFVLWGMGGAAVLLWIVWSTLIIVFFAQSLVSLLLSFVRAWRRRR